MKVKKFLKALLGMSFLTLGITTVNEVKEVNAADAIAEVDFTTKSAKHSAYTDSWAYGDWTVSGGANNNGGWAYVKMGGKSSNLSSYKDIYISSPAVGSKVSEVTVNIVAGSLPKSGMSVNSWGLYVYSDAAMSTQIDYVAGGTIAKTANLFSFVPTNGTSWPANSYYKVVWDLANTTTTNGIIWLDNITIYEAVDTTASYTVNYVTNCDKTIDSATITGGSLLETPTIEKNGYTLEGWYTTAEFASDSKWSFEESVVTDNVTLYAKWLNNECENVSTINSYMDLAYKYSATINESTETKTVTMTTNASVYTGAITLSTLDEVTNITSSFDNADCFSSIEYTKGEASNFYIKANEMRIYNPSGTITLTEAEGVDIDSITPTIISGSGWGTADNLIFTNNNGVWTITADMKTKVSSFQITYTQTNAVTYSDAEFRLKFGIDKAIDDIMANLPEGAVYGLKISDGSKEENPVVFEREDDTCYYVVVSLGDVMNNINRATMKFSVQAYVISEGITYYSDVVKTYSVVDMVEAYYTNGDTRVESLYNFFESKGLYA